MVRGVLATTAAVALALDVTVYAFGEQHGQGNQGHAAQPAAHTTTGNSTTTTTRTTSTTPTTKTTTTTTPTPASGTTLSSVQLKVQSHTQLANMLQSRLPVGTNVVSAAGGFRNLGQFVAAVNVSHNLRIPFSKLKTDMVTNRMSLGQSIQALRPSADASRETERAETQARRMIDSDK
jgi:hypothetical protein